MDEWSHEIGWMRLAVLPMKEFDEVWCVEGLMITYRSN